MLQHLVSMLRFCFEFLSLLVRVTNDSVSLWQADFITKTCMNYFYTKDKGLMHVVFPSGCFTLWKQCYQENPGQSDVKKYKTTKRFSFTICVFCLWLYKINHTDFNLTHWEFLLALIFDVVCLDVRYFVIHSWRIGRPVAFFDVYCGFGV